MTTSALDPGTVAMVDPGVKSSAANLVDRLVGRAIQLYTLPAVAVKVLELTNDPQVDSHALKECIENDPALTTKVLRVVNSSLFGLRREVSDLGQALGLLGTKPLKLLVLGFSLPGGLFAGVGAGTLGWYWRRTLTKAVAAREICETIWRRPGDEAFVAALLQDLGMLLLIQELGLPYIDFLEKARQRAYDVPALERTSMGMDHAAVTAALLTHWRLPKALVEAVVWRPDDPGDEPAAPRPGSLGSVVYLAEWVARLLADDRAEALGQLLSIGRRDHHLTSEQLASLVETLEEKVRGLAEAFSLELPQAADYRELLALAHARLADVAAAAAADMLRDGQTNSPSPSEASPLAAAMRTLGAATGRLAHRSTPPKSGRTAIHAAPRSIVGESPPEAAVAVSRTIAGSGEADRGLLGQLAGAVAACRQARCPLSLLLVELGRADELVLIHGMERFYQLRSKIEAACRGVDHERSACLPHGEAGFAVILVACDRQLAARLANRLIEQVSREGIGTELAKRSAATLGVGLATVGMPPKNFPAKDLLVAANRCLYGSHASGGGVVKSIEIY